MGLSECTLLEAALEWDDLEQYSEQKKTLGRRVEVDQNPLPTPDGWHKAMQSLL